MALSVWSPWFLPVSVMLIGARQLGLTILMHDAAHGALHPNAKVNDFLGHWLAGAPMGGHLKAYRQYHLTHHRFAQQEEDPDLILSKPFPVTRTSLRRKIIRGSLAKLQSMKIRIDGVVLNPLPISDDRASYYFSLRNVRRFCVDDVQVMVWLPGDEVPLAADCLDCVHIGIDAPDGMRISYEHVGQPADAPRLDARSIRN